MSLERTLEPEVMESAEEALSYDTMDHDDVNRCFVHDFLEVVERSTLISRQVIVDLGTGTARIPMVLCQRLPVAPLILACDLSIEMLRVARTNISKAGLCNEITPIYANARNLPIANASCSLVISNSIIHHIPQPKDVFQEVRRIAGPGTVIFFRDLLRPESVSEVDGLVQRWAGAADEHQQQMFRDSLHAALTISEVRHLLTSEGFGDSWVSQTSDRHWTIAGQIPMV